MSDPALSVVIPTRARHEPLAACLERLAPGRQTLAAESYEVIVTDDGHDAPARAALGARFPWVRWSQGPARGAAANRNAGTRLARAPVLVFVDDDCLPGEGWLAAYAAALEPGVDVYEGRTTCVQGVRSPMEMSPVNLTGGNLWSCNFAIRRQAYDRLGGFDERFLLQHEDVDFLYRVREHGLAMRFVPAATVDHPPRRLAFGARLARLHEFSILVMVLHPPTRGLLWYLQNQARARLSLIVRRPKSRDTLVALASLAVELVEIVRWWPTWMRRAHAAAQRPR